MPPSARLLLLLLPLSACEPKLGDTAGEESGAPDVAPGLTLVSPADGQTFGAGDVITVSGAALDDHDTAADLALVVTSSLDAEVARPALAEDGSFAEAITLSAGVHVLTVAVTDTAGNVATAEVAVTVVVDEAGEPPSAPTVHVEPTTPITGASLTAVLDTPSVDPEGAEVSYTWRWTRGEDASEELSTAASVPADVVFRGDTVQVVVTPNDGAQDGPAATATVTVGNAAPANGVVSLSPADPTVSDTLTCAIGGVTDAEADPLTFAFAWRVDGVDVGTSASLPAGSAADGDEVQCVVTVSDGYDTVVFASPLATVTGRAWEGDVSATDAWLTLDGTVAGGAFGKTVAFPGDMDGDGLSEIAVGANGESAYDGAVYLFASADLTGPLTAADAIASWDGAWTEGQLGGFRSLAAPGDLDGDGIAELLFAAADADAGGDGAGEVYLHYGGATAGLDADPQDADWIVGATAGDQAGARLAAGDIDGDGFPDLLIAAPTTAEGGVVAAFYGDGARRSGAAALTDGDWRIEADAAGDGLGWTTRFVGDVDADGYEDFVLGALYADPTGSQSGALGLISGGARRTGDDALADVITARFEGDAAGDRLGYDAVGDLDLDDDGIGDLLVAAYLDDAAATDAGTVYAFLGGAAWATALSPADADATILGTTAGARFGHVLGTPGDLDGDGATDLLLGALFDSPTGLSNQGSASMLLAPDWASVPTDTDVPWRASGEAAGDLFGDALSTGRADLDGDGRADFAIGAQGHDAGGTDAGRVYVWRGR